MSLKVTNYQFPTDPPSTLVEAWIWPEHVQYSADGSGRIVLWVHRTAASAIQWYETRPSDVISITTGDNYPTLAEVLAKAAEYAVTLGLPPHLAITEAIYWGLQRDRWPDGVRVDD